MPLGDSHRLLPAAFVNRDDLAFVREPADATQPCLHTILVESAVNLVRLLRPTPDRASVPTDDAGEGGPVQEQALQGSVSLARGFVTAPVVPTLNRHMLTTHGVDQPVGVGSRNLPKRRDERVQVSQEDSFHGARLQKPEGNRCAPTEGLHEQLRLGDVTVNQCCDRGDHPTFRPWVPQGRQ